MPDWSFWEDLMRLGRTAPRKGRDRRPRDLARNFDHYLDGTPRQD
jgi:hypothetical protein